MSFTTTPVYIPPEHCSSRLPCGLCLITNQPCPMMPVTYEPYCTSTTTNVMKGE